MEDFGTLNKRQHMITLQNRTNCSISGVLDAISFDLNEIVLETDQGLLNIRGMDLHVSKLLLDKGEVEIEGQVDSFVYSDGHGDHIREESFLTKLFK